MSTPAAAARDVALRLATLFAVELGATLLLASLEPGSGSRGALLGALGLTSAGALVSGVLGTWFVAQQRVLHRAQSAPSELDRFVPSTRIVAQAEHLPLLLALAPRLAVGLAALALDQHREVVVAVALGAVVPTLRVVREPIEQWLSRLPAAELPDRSVAELTREAMIVGVLPALAVAVLGASVVSGPGSLLLALPALVHAALLVRRVRAAREEIASVAMRIETSAPGVEVPALSTGLGRVAWGTVSVGLERAAAELRAEGEAHRALQNAERVRARFMAAMSHDLRSPLNAIVGFAQYLEGGAGGPLNTAQRESIVMVRRSAQELLRLLVDILDSARLESGRLALQRAWTPPVEIVTEAAREAREIVAGQSVGVEVHLEPGLSPVRVDGARIAQALVALVRHAASGKRTGKLELHARRGPNLGGEPSLRFEVRDRAATWTQAEPTVRLDAGFGQDEASGRRVAGLGMALSLAQELVRQHDGELWAERREEGVGFVLSVPRDAADT